jgi:hypothetical protein
VIAPHLCTGYAGGRRREELLGVRGGTAGEHCLRRPARGAVQHAVDEYVARAGIVAPPPHADPAERPQAMAGQAPETLNTRAERIAAVSWCTGGDPPEGCMT